MTHEFTYSSVIIAPGDTLVRKTARMPVGKSQNNSRGIKNWVNLGFWETDHLLIPYANILP